MGSLRIVTAAGPIVLGMPIHTTKRLAVLVVLALLLVACGSGDTPLNEASTAAGTSSATATEPTAVPTTEPVAVPAEEPTPTAVPAVVSDDNSTADSSNDASSTDSSTTGTSTGSSSTDDSNTADNSTADSSGSMAATTSLSPPAAATGSTLAAVNAAQWGPNVSIQVTDTSFVFSSNGYPSHELPDQFLVPADGNMPPFSDDDIDADFNIANTSELILESPISETITLNPVYSSTTTDTTLGTIGVTISGVPIFNDYEDFGREFVALDDNLSLNGVYFIDACNGHPLANGLSYHYHGVPYCITDAVDVAGQHSTVIGFLLDGFPLYGSKDAGGTTITGASLDACSGHFGPTPEFPDGIYHYHLTEDMAPYSIDCFHGEIEGYGGGMVATARTESVVLPVLPCMLDYICSTVKLLPP